MPRQRASERSCDNAIKETLAYRAVFRYPLSFFQLATMLIAQKPYKFDFFAKEISKMACQKNLGYKDGKFYLTGVKPISWETRYKKSIDEYARAKQILTMLTIVPWIKMVAITGSLAAYNTDKSSDIDVFIITQKNRLWISRAFTVALLKVLNAYVRHDGDPGRMCPNLFIDESKMEWNTKAQTVYTAHEIVMMQPVINKDNAYFKFIKANTWVTRYFPHFKVDTTYKNVKSLKGSPIVDWLDRIAYKIQHSYMKKKITTETVEKHIAHFKKHDNALQILDEFARISKNHVTKNTFSGLKAS